MAVVVGIGAGVERVGQRGGIGGFVDLGSSGVGADEGGAVGEDRGGDLVDDGFGEIAAADKEGGDGDGLDSLERAAGEGVGGAGVGVGGDDVGGNVRVVEAEAFDLAAESAGFAEADEAEGAGGHGRVDRFGVDADDGEDGVEVAVDEVLAGGGGVVEGRVELSGVEAVVGEEAADDLAGAALFGADGEVHAVQVAECLGGRVGVDEDVENLLVEGGDDADVVAAGGAVLEQGEPGFAGLEAAHAHDAAVAGEELEIQAWVVAADGGGHGFGQRVVDAAGLAGGDCQGVGFGLVAVVD